MQMVFFAGCKSKDQKAGGPTIRTGETVELVNQKIHETGILHVDKPNDSLSGLMMYMPDAAFGGSRRFSISYQPILSHDLGPDFDPISPLITISCGGGFSDSIVTIEIPIHLSEGKFAMGFLYDERTGKLEGMPLLKLEKDRVVVALRNFSHSKQIKGSKLAAQVGDLTDEVVKLIVSAINEDRLLEGVESGFNPGVDDMPNVNCGTFLNRNGICDGQSQAMLWYYDNKKMNGAQPLYQLLDNDGGMPTPNCHFDDRKAMMFASYLQTETKDYLLPFYWLMKAYNVEFGSLLGDKMTLRAFAYAILVTKQPQYVVIAQVEGNSHAMVIYKVKGNHMYVADPNFPGNTERRIVYDPVARRFKPYSSKVNSESPGVDFISFFYYGKTALHSYYYADKYWKKVEDGTIGKEEYPEMKIQVTEKKDGELATRELPDNYQFKKTEGLTPILMAYAPAYEGKGFFCDTAGHFSHRQEDILSGKTGMQMIGVCLYDNDIFSRWAGFKWAKINIMEEEQEFNPPMTGELPIRVHVGDQTIELEQCEFSVEGKSFVLTGHDKEVLYGLTIQINNWHGTGDYENVFSSSLAGVADPVKGTYSSQSGRVTISKWGEGRLEGVFEFTSNGVKISGYFEYR